METPKEYYYTYYSYEEWGKGYFGSRKCYCLPEEDINYFGSSKDKTFKPTKKIILKSDYTTREEAYADEIILQQYYKVVENPHFANKSYQTSTKFYVPKEKSREYVKKSHQTQRKLGIGVYGQTKEERDIVRKKGHKTQKQLGIGFWGLTLEQRQENAKKGEEKRKKNKSGLYSLSSEQKSEAGRKSAQQLHSQKWMCLETGHITNAGALTRYQKHRGIDTSKRKRIA